jgi:hypothetical protein
VHLVHPCVLQHAAWAAATHAFLFNTLIEGRPDVA